MKVKNFIPHKIMIGSCEILTMAFAAAVWITMGEALNDIIIPLGIFAAFTLAQTLYFHLRKKFDDSAFTILLMLSISKAFITFALEFYGDMLNIYFGRDDTFWRSVFIVLFLVFIILTFVSEFFGILMMKIRDKKTAGSQSEQ